MNKNYKKIIMCLSASAAVAVLAATIVPNAFAFHSNAEVTSHAFTFATLNASAESKMDGSFNGTTTDGNPVKINYHDYRVNEGDGTLYNYFDTYSYFELDSSTQLGSITSVDFKNFGTSGTFHIECGWYDEATSSVNYSFRVSSYGSRGGNKSVDLSQSKPNYIKVVSDNGYAFEECTINYECTTSENPYAVVDGFELYNAGENYVLTAYKGSDTTITLPATYNGKPVTEIGASAFANSSVQSLTIPSSYKIIGESAFKGSASLTSLTLNEGLEQINSYAFNQTKITTLSIPDSVTTIAYAAFMYAPIETISISTNSQLSYLADCAFRLSKITSIFIPKSLTNCYESFTNITTLESIVVDAENTTYASVNGVLYTKDMKTLKKYPEGKKDASFIMPDTVTQVPDYGLVNSYVGSVTLSSNLESFGAYNSLYNCSEFNFNNCKLTTIQSYVLSRSDTMTEIELPEGIKYIQGISLSENPNLTTISLPSTIESIDNQYAIHDNPKLVTLNFAGTMEQWNALGKTNFSGCTLLTQITCSDGVVTL